jgi:hypothetical protein
MDKKYFTVSVSCRIGQGSYVPGVCYELTENISAAVLALVQKGTARVYDEEVRMVSGRPVPVSRAQKATASVQAAEGVGNDVSAVSSASNTESAPQPTRKVTVNPKSHSRSRSKKSGIRF